MESTDKIASLDYTASCLQLLVGFDSGRVVIFNGVARVLYAMLLSDPDPDFVLRTHVLGKFEWSEVASAIDLKMDDLHADDSFMVRIA